MAAEITGRVGKVGSSWLTTPRISTVRDWPTPVSVYAQVCRQKSTISCRAGWIAFLNGHILLNRKRRDRSLGSLNKAVDNIIKGQKRTLCIFPEGTRTDDGNLRLPFKKAFFIW